MAATIAVIIGLFVRPEITLDILWFALIPILPATFLINTGLWRGICPLATTNTLFNRSGARKLPREWIFGATLVGMVLLALLVPARHVVFNENGLVLAAVIIVVVVLALGLGWVFEKKGGFCNSICPVLPVERLYGQSPLVAVRNPRCVPCTLCTSRGCLDLDPAIPVRDAVGQGSGVRDWLRTPFGVFAAAFPGFVLGYYQIPDGPVDAWLSVYATITLSTVVSLVAVAVLTLILRIPTHRLLPFLGALAVGIYYWYAAPASMAAFGLPGGLVLRWVLEAFVAVWLIMALRRSAQYRVFSRPVAAHPVTPRFPVGQAPR